MTGQRRAGGNVLSKLDISLDSRPDFCPAHGAGTPPSVLAAGTGTMVT